MSEVRLIYEGFADGVWHGLLVGVAKSKKVPAVSASLKGQALKDPKVSPRETMVAAWDVELLLDKEVLQHGSSVVLFQLDGSDIGSFEICAGPIDLCDMASELRLMRAELDLLKRAFRAQSRAS